MNDLTTTPQHVLKPHLSYVGKVLGCDLYIDTIDPAKRDTAERLLTNLIDGLYAKKEQ